MSFDPKKPVQTRGGRPARIIATDRRGATGEGISRYPLVALVSQAEGGEAVESYTADGLFSLNGTARGLDLVNVPKRVSRYLNLGRAFEAPKYAAQSNAHVYDVLELITEGDDVVSASIIPHGKATQIDAKDKFVG